MTTEPLSAFKQSFVNELVDSITNTYSYYYAFASDPVPNANGIPTLTEDDLTKIQNVMWPMMFGKKLGAGDIRPMVNNITWTTNTVYTRYDNTVNSLANANFYVIVEPDTLGGYYNVYKCIDNANGGYSTYQPDQIQLGTFEKDDGYKWRYVYSVSTAVYEKFATADYLPVYANDTVVASANEYSGVEVTVIANSGSNYNAYHDGTVRSVVNSTVIQIESTASSDNNFYVNNAIYLFNNGSPSAQLRTIVSYVSNNSGKWVYLGTAANTSIITAGITEYKISPRVAFDTDGTIEPSAYSVVNTSSNSIANVIMIETGTQITRATATIVSNSSYGTGANLYCIVPPPGGHGANPKSELFTRAVAFAFEFANSEANTILTSCQYNKIGILKNPYIMNSDTTKNATPFTTATFSQMLEANTTAAFSNGEIVTGNTSGAKAAVVFSNSTYIYLAGDKDFSNGEYIVSANGTLSAQITINNIGNIFTKDITPIYTQNINDVVRAADQTEQFKVIIQI